MHNVANVDDIHDNNMWGESFIMTKKGLDLVKE